jgi:hypothetical protein
VGVLVGWGVSVGIGVGVGVFDGRGVGVGVSVWVGVAVAVKVGIGVRVDAAMALSSRCDPSCVSATATTSQTMIMIAKMTRRIFMRFLWLRPCTHVMGCCTGSIIAGFRRFGKKRITGLLAHGWKAEPCDSASVVLLWILWLPMPELLGCCWQPITGAVQ